MKFCTIFLIGFLLVSASAFGALSVADWQKLTQMFQESEARTKEAIKESETRMQKAIKESEARTKEYVSQEIAKVNLRIDEMNKRIETESQAVRDRFGDVNNRLNVNFGLLVALVGIVIGLPLLRERKKEREQDEQLEAQKQQLAAQQQLIEVQQQQLETQQQLLAQQQQEMDAVRKELETLKQHQVTSH